MCFSAEASFTVGAALVPAGVYCLWSAALKKPSYAGLAAVPLIFGFQQIGEGFVWLGLNDRDAAVTRSASLFFLFLAQAFWPFWFPLLTTFMEPQPKRKAVFGCLTVLATAWFWALYYPLLIDPGMLQTKLDHHSIAYIYDELPVYHYIAKTPLRILYFLSVALPPLLGSETWGRIPGLVLGALALIAIVVYDYAFVSVWCFFAAVMASYLVFLFYRLPLAQVNTLAAVPSQPIST